MLFINTMSPNLNENERELVKLVNYFRKRAEKMMKDGKLDAQHEIVITSCEKLVSQLDKHAEYRNAILLQREKLKTLIKDNAHCPKCNTAANIKLVGTEKNESDWKINRYKCRKCNIEFIWNRPNNPWDMIPYIEDFLVKLNSTIEKDMPEELRAQSHGLSEQMKQSLEVLKPVIESSDTEFKELEAKELEMATMIHDFRNYLMIEKIKMDSWETRPGASLN